MTIQGTEHSGFESHDALLYGETASATIDNPANQYIVDVKASNANFFGPDERVNIYEAHE